MDSCAPFGSLTIMMGHPSLRWSTFGHTTSCVHVIHRKYRLRLHARLTDEIFSLNKEGYDQSKLKVFHSLFQKDFSKSSTVLRCRHGTSRLPEAASSNGMVGMSDGNTMDVVILSNGPGEVLTWVKPVVNALRKHFNVERSKLRISVLLAPCPHASGGEMKVIQSFEEVDRCLGPESFLQLLLLGRVPEGWDWRKRGVCIFLGGDQFNVLALGRRLRYKTIVYAENYVQWPGLVDIYALRSQGMMGNVPRWAQRSCRVVGDLIRDAIYKPEYCLFSKESLSQVTPFCDFEINAEPALVVGILPGSKNVKLSIGVPYLVAVAERIQERMGKNIRFILPLAPTVSLSMLEQYADPNQNKFISKFQWGSGELVLATSNQHCGMVGNLLSKNGLQIEIWQDFPTYKLYKKCTLCLTTTGTNTAELGSLGVPMVVVLPTYALEVYRGATGGLLGLLSNAPGKFGDAAAILINTMMLKTVGFLSWPNRWAKEEIVPELIGRIEPIDVAKKAIELLESPNKLKNMQEALLSVSNLHEHERIIKKNIVKYQHGAATAIAHIVDELMSI